MKSLEELGQIDRLNRIGEFAQHCRFIALGRGSIQNTLAAAKRGHASQRVMELLEKATVLPGGAGWGEQLTSPVLRAFVDSLRFSSAFAAAMAANLIVRVPLGDSVGLVMAGASDASEVGAGDAIPVRRLDVSSTNTPRRKVAAMVVLTNELLKQFPQAAESVITRELRSAVGAAVDAAFVTEITTGVTPLTSQGTLADARNLLLNVGLRPGSRPFWVVGATAAIRIATEHSGNVRAAPDATPTGGTFLGYPFYASAGIDPSTLLLADGARIAGALEDVEVSHSSQALVASEDAPAGGVAGSPAALTALSTTALISLWQEDASGIKAVQYFGIRVLREGAVASVSMAGSPA